MKKIIRRIYENEQLSLPGEFLNILGKTIKTDLSISLSPDGGILIFPIECCTVGH